MRPSQDHRTTAPHHAVIVLGASNVVRTLGTAYCAAKAALPEPLDFLVAAGHGRSYGQESSYFGRVLPGIRDCGLWSSVANLAPRSVTALITDVGNDLAYGVPPETIEAWVDECVRRLAEFQGTTILTQLPLASLRNVGPWRFRIFQRLIFPRATFTLADVLRDVAEVNERLRAIASRHGALLMEPADDWYGLDPIHIRLSRATEAWRTLWSAARSARDPSSIDGLWTRWRTHRALRRARPLQQVRHGRDERCAQPALHLDDGSRVWSF